MSLLTFLVEIKMTSTKLFTVQHLGFFSFFFLCGKTRWSTCSGLRVLFFAVTTAPSLSTDMWVSIWQPGEERKSDLVDTPPVQRILNERESWGFTVSIHFLPCPAIGILGLCCTFIESVYRQTHKWHHPPQATFLPEFLFALVGLRNLNERVKRTVKTFLVTRLEYCFSLSLLKFLFMISFSKF